MIRMSESTLNSFASASGYSLVEATISIAIVTGILLPLIALIASMSSNPIGRNVTGALEHVQLFAEFCMAQQFPDISSADSSARWLTNWRSESNGSVSGQVRTESETDSTNGLYHFQVHSWSTVTSDTLGSLEFYVWGKCE